MKASTNDFNQSNFIGSTHFGRLFRGKFEGKCVTVKTWDEEFLESISSKYNDENLIINEEVKFWTNPITKGHPNLVTLIGYCWEKDVKCVVYDLNPMDTLHNVLVKDELNWIQRINVIHEVAKLLKFIHSQEKQNMTFNISASHVLLDKEDWGFNVEDGIAMTKIAMQCIDFFPMNRPTMKEVLQDLENLVALQRLSDTRPTKREKNYVSL
ncbi:putative cysteine-rich receptor-like protein kinase 35 [Senna tora]|uniref:Putative cysteine-rich receptor-like protein kinase 35 n=1 Tax=Senna tora TaxID=362788 RepID=A0A834XKG1_9FABA|nr:putative cysteine-rich receptor-like protein kinase 35 [Senna tora]